MFDKLVAEGYTEEQAWEIAAAHEGLAYGTQLRFIVPGHGEVAAPFAITVRPRDFVRI